MNDTTGSPRQARPGRRHGPLATAAAVILLIALAVFLLSRPRPPAEFPELKEYDRTLTVSYGQAILNAQLSEGRSQAIVRTLSRQRFRPASAVVTREDIALQLGEQGTIYLTQVGDKTFAMTEAGEKTSVYRLKDECYQMVADLIEEAFPDGVQRLELEPWWKEYLSIATHTILSQDFRSAKEIPSDFIVDYTYNQMVADGTALDFQDPEKQVDVIPYDLLLTRARGYFGDGATPAIKQTTFYNGAANCFVFSSMPREYYGNYPYGDLNDYTHCGYYKLISLTRDETGTITAVFEDYNRLGFQERGTLNKMHYLTMGRSQEGDYRFLSKHSELCNPAEVSVEGMFSGYGTLADFTPAQAADGTLTDGMALGNAMLLHAVRYTKDSSQMTLKLIAPEDGEVIASHELKADGGSFFLDVLVRKGQVLVKTSKEIIRLDSMLEESGRIELPTSPTREIDPYGYDITPDLRTMVYSDRYGVQLMDMNTGFVTQLAAHPRPLSAVKADEEKQLYRRPHFVQDGRSVLVSNIDGESVRGYSLIYLDKREAGQYVIKDLEIPVKAGVVPNVTSERLLLSVYPSEADSEMDFVHHTVHWFDTGITHSFDLEYDPDAMGRVCSTRYLYYFAREEEEPAPAPAKDDKQPQKVDRYYRLWRIDLKNATRESVELRIQNASPYPIAVNDQERVLFAYVSPSGEGFGITQPAADLLTE